MAYLSEAAVEQVVLDHLAGLGYAISTDAEIGPDGKIPEREAYADVVLVKRLVAAIEKLNPAIPADARGELPYVRRLSAVHFEHAAGRPKLYDQGIDVLADELFAQAGLHLLLIRGAARQRSAKRDDC
jgi:hypothetical protein